MRRSRIGPIVTALIVADVGLIFVLNREPREAVAPAPRIESRTSVPDEPADPVARARPAGFREYPIGDDAVKNHLRIAAVWLPSVGMAGMPEPSGDVIHVEADVRATADNPNGFAKDEFVPYLKIAYQLRGETVDTPLQSGELTPMIASDGLHYGANVARPAPGRYRLVYTIQPPSAGGLGRHSDTVTGVAPWWEPFEVRFDWTMEAGQGATPAVAAGE